MNRRHPGALGHRAICPAKESKLIKAVIFDIDGTLVDSVDLHARAWQETFSHFGHEVAFQDVRSQIGKGGDQLMPVFLSEEEIEQRGEEIENFRSALFKKKYLSQVRSFPETRRLLQRIKRNGQGIALASSAKGDELATYKKIARIDDLIDEETSSDDAEKSKPHPDIFEAALDRLGLDADEAIAVGDSPYDAQAAGKIGLRTIGVLCGGFPEQDLRAAGCVAIYRDPADLLTRFARSVIGADAASRRRTGILGPSALATVGLVMAVAAARMIRRGTKA
jgi:HAD superfamily hydrolase (TIGR01509 family)